MKKQATDYTVGDPAEQKEKIWFQIAKLVLQNPKTVLQEDVEKELKQATFRWSKTAFFDRQKSTGHESLIPVLKNMRRSLIRREAGRMSAWIEKSWIRHSWPELPEYRIRRVAVRGLLMAFRRADSVSDFHRRAPFYVEQNLRRFSCNSPHCWSFRINPRTGKSTCTRGSGRMF